MGEPVIVRMWEVKCHPEAMADVLTFVCESALPDLEANPRHIDSEVFTSVDHRIVVISRWRAEPVSLPDPPRYKVDGPPHSWDFSRVDR